MAEKVIKIWSYANGMASLSNIATQTALGADSLNFFAASSKALIYSKTGNKVTLFTFNSKSVDAPFASGVDFVFSRSNGQGGVVDET